MGFTEKLIHLISTCLDDQQLTDEKALHLSQKITTKPELRNFAICGLRVDIIVVQKHITNNPSDIESAAFDLLVERCENEPNGQVTYENVWQALQVAERKSHNEALL